MGAILEKNIEDIIYEHHHTLHERGFIKFSEFKGIMDRQVRLVSGKRIDLLYVGNDDILVLELKKGCVDGEALCQLLTYIKEVRSHDLYDKKGLIGERYSVKGALVGESVSSSVVDAIDFVSGVELEVYIYSYLVDGMHFTMAYKTS